MGKKGADLNSFYEDSMASYYIFSSGLNIHWFLRNVFRSLSRLQTVQFSRKKKRRTDDGSCFWGVSSLLMVI